MIQLVVFDMAGTTVLDNDAVHKALIAALAEFGYEVNREEANDVMGIAKPVAIQTILELKGIPATIISPAYIEKIHQSFLRIMKEYYHYSPEVVPTENAEIIFRFLKKKGAKIALNTGFTRDIADIIVNRLGWLEKKMIDVVVTSDEVEAGRPAPFMIRKIMEITEVSDPKNVIKVGDTAADLLEGTNAGCGYVIGVTSGAYTKEELVIHPHTHLISDLAQLCEILFPKIEEND